MGPSRLWPRREPPTSPTVRSCSPLARLDDTKYSQPRADMGLTHAFTSLALPLQMGIGVRAPRLSSDAPGHRCSTASGRTSWPDLDRLIRPVPARSALIRLEP